MRRFVVTLEFAQAESSTLGLKTMLYAVFARISGIAVMTSDRIAGAVERLAQVGEDVRRRFPEITTHSSVYGRFWVVPHSVDEALRCAESVLDSAAAAGVGLGLGVTVGRIEEAVDLLQESVAGMAINHAARLAFLEGNEGRIAVSEEIVEEALDVGRFTDASFSSVQAGRVKRTELRYRWLERPRPSLAEAPSSDVPEILAQVVSYDIVRFSDMSQRDLLRLVEDLGHAVRRSLEAAGLAKWDDQDGLWYAPAGDGGIVVFGPGRGRAAWTFAKALLAQTADRVPVRLGIASGIVVAVEGNLPVGKGLLKADRLNGLAEVGQPCVSDRFWRSLDDDEKDNWLATSIYGDDEGLKVQKRASAVLESEGSVMKLRRSRLKTGRRYEFVCLQIHIAGHSTLTDSEHILHLAKERLSKQIEGIVSIYEGQRLRWEGDGGAFLFPVTDGQDFDEAVRAAFRILEALPSVNEELRLSTRLSQPMSVRISLDAGQAVYYKNPGLITSDFLNNFLKHERVIGSVDTVSITDRVYRQLSEPFRARFVEFKNSEEISSQIFRAAETKDGKKHEQDRILAIANNYIEDGYEVLIRPISSDLPAFLESYDVDILARKGEHLVALSAKPQAGPSGPSEPSILVTASRDVDYGKSLLGEAERLLSPDTLRAALLMGWAALEAAARESLRQEFAAESDTLTPRALMEALLAENLIKKSEFARLRESLNLRNMVGHGVRPPQIPSDIVNFLLDLTRRLFKVSGSAEEPRTSSSVGLHISGSAAATLYRSRLNEVEHLKQLAEQASSILQEILGQARGNVSEEWNLAEDGLGRSMVTLTLSDATGSVTATFDPKELEKITQIKLRLTRLWSDLLQIRSHTQIQQFTRRPGE